MPGPDVRLVVRLCADRFLPATGATSPAAAGPDGAVFVSTPEGRVRLAPHPPPGVALPDGVIVLDVRGPGARGPAPRGAALVAGPSGPQVLDLAEPADVAVLLARIGADTPPETVAGLVARYAHAGEGPHHVLIGGPEDLPGVLPDDVRAALGLVAAASAPASGGGREIAFFTCFVRPEPPDGALRIGVDRWLAEISAPGALAWRSEPHARRLESPRYAAAGVS